jgi:hypothetical protein
VCDCEDAKGAAGVTECAPNTATAIVDHAPERHIVATFIAGASR